MTIHSAVTPDQDAVARLAGIPSIDLAGNFRAAIAESSHHANIAQEITKLARGPGRLSPSEYFYYRLWDRHISAEEKARFVGKAAQKIMHAACNDHAWLAVAHDKILTQMVLAGQGISMPPLLAVAHPFRSCGGSAHLRNQQELAGFFRKPGGYPMFGKPVDGIYSLGTFHATSFDEASDKVIMSNGSQIDVSHLAADLISYQPGYLLQQVLQSNHRLAEVTGNRLCSVRVLVLLTANGPVIESAVCKIPVGQNIADNFWRPGNLLAAVNLPDGVMTRISAGFALDLTPVSHHPDTGKPILNKRIPDWQRVCDMAIKASALLPMVRTQSWDIAVTDAGPVVLEVNWGGDMNLHQLAHRRGMLSQRFCQHLVCCGYLS
jgi:hypothetical protein